jgi:GH25 family lysozyme M1 (1,4-beta-N-acetylmuramidase)
VFNSPRLIDHRRQEGRRLAHGRVTRFSGLVLAAGLLTGGVVAVSAPAALGATTASARTTTVNPRTVNVKTAPLSLLRKLAWNDFMGHSLPRHRATSVNPNAVPLLLSAGTRRPAASSVVYGIDVSAYQGNVNWTAVKNAGKQFAYLKATEGNYYVNPYFTEQYNGSYNAGLIRGVYAFAIPNRSSGANQADYLKSHGGGWSADGKTLPAALDIEYDPYSSNICYGLSASSMRSWISSFISEYHRLTSRWAVIYSTTNWWDSCTGSWSGPWKNSPYWVACYCSSAGALPPGVPTWTFWQYADAGSTPGDQDVFNGAYARLVALAKNT